MTETKCQEAHEIMKTLESSGLQVSWSLGKLQANTWLSVTDIHDKTENGAMDYFNALKNMIGKKIKLRTLRSLYCPRDTCHGSSSLPV